MKIMISGSFWHGSLEESYTRAFESLGWNVVRFDWEQIARAHPLATTALMDKVLRMRIADRIGKILVNAVEETHPDLVLIVKGRFIHPEVIQKIASLLSGQMVVNFNPDSPWEPQNSSKRLTQSIPFYHTHFTWNAEFIDSFTAAGSRSTHFLPFAYDPKLHYPTKRLDKQESKQEFDAVFIGTYAEERDKLLSELSGCRVGIWGNDWNRARYVPREWIKGKAVYGEEATHNLGRSLCALNILRPQNYGSHNMRTYEIPATCHAMLTTRSEMQERLFAEGKEAMFFDGVSELNGKIEILRRNPQLVREIAQSGYERIKDETYTRRAATMLGLLGLRAMD